MQPYIDSAGCIQTKRVLPEPPPRDMIPEAVLRWDDLYRGGMVSLEHGLAQEQVYNVRRMLRRYHLLEARPRLSYAGKTPEVQRKMQREKQRRYRQERRQQQHMAG